MTDEILRLHDLGMRPDHIAARLAHCAVTLCQIRHVLETCRPIAMRSQPQEDLRYG